jgi:hypothetical protein
MKEKLKNFDLRTHGFLFVLEELRAPKIVLRFADL